MEKFKKIQYNPNNDSILAMKTEDGDTENLGEYSQVLEDYPEIPQDALENAMEVPHSWVMVANFMPKKDYEKNFEIDVTSLKNNLMCPSCGSYNVEEENNKFKCLDCNNSSDNELAGITSSYKPKNELAEEIAALKDSLLNMLPSDFEYKETKKKIQELEKKSVKLTEEPQKIKHVGIPCPECGTNMKEVGKDYDECPKCGYGKDLNKQSSWKIKSEKSSIGLYFDQRMNKQAEAPFQIEDIVGNPTDDELTGTTPDNVDMNDIDMTAFDGGEAASPNSMDGADFAGGAPEDPNAPPGGLGGNTVAPQVDDTDWDNMFVENIDSMGQQNLDDMNEVDTSHLV